MSRQAAHGRLGRVRPWAGSWQTGQAAHGSLPAWATGLRWPPLLDMKETVDALGGGMDETAGVPGQGMQLQCGATAISQYPILQNSSGTQILEVVVALSRARCGHSNMQ